MIRTGQPVRCKGRWRGQPCNRFLGIFIAAVGHVKCARCGNWQAIEIASLDAVAV